MSSKYKLSGRANTSIDASNYSQPRSAETDIKPIQIADQRPRHRPVRLSPNLSVFPKVADPIPASTASWLVNNRQLSCPAFFLKPHSRPQVVRSPMSLLEDLNSDCDNSALERHSPIQQAWIRRQPLFESYGYTLRPRFRPGWIPSWRRDPTVNILRAEDRLTSMVSSGLYVYTLGNNSSVFRCL